MGAVEHSSGTIEACLSDLEQMFGSFSVNQTTFTVPPARYERLGANMDGCVDLYAKIRNQAAEILHVTRSGEDGLPHATGTPSESLVGTIRRQVRTQTGVTCVIDGIDRATIIGVRDAESHDRDACYRLSVVFNGFRRAGAPTDRAEWREDTVEPGQIRA